MSNFNMNKVILGGRMTADPELKTTPGGVPVTSFSVAVNRTYKPKDGEPQADFINITAWRGTAEFITRYFRKGSSICIVGAIQTRTWTDQNGAKRYATEVVADEAHFVDSKADGSAGSAGAAGQAPQYAAPPVQPHFEEIASDEELPF